MQATEITDGLSRGQRATRGRTSRSRGGLRRIEHILDRSSASVIAIAVLSGLLCAIAWQSGGYFPPAYLRAGAIAFTALAVLLALRPPNYPISREAQLAMLGLVLLAGWAIVSTAWSPAPSVGLANGQRDLCYVGIFGLAVIGSGSGRPARLAVWSAFAAAVAIVLAGIVSRLYPTAPAIPLLLDPSQYRLDYPLGYWNAYGALAGVAAVLATGLAADRRTALVLRALASAAAVLSVVAMYFSLSRGAWLSVAIAAVVLLAISPKRGAMLLSAAIVAAAAATAIAVLRSYPALVDNPFAGHGEAAAGRAYGPILFALAAAAAVVQALVAYPERTVRALISDRAGVHAAGLQRLRTAGIVGLIALVIATLFSTAALSGVHSFDRLVSRQWHDFVHPTTGAISSGSARLTSTSTTRGDLYRVALDEFIHAPLAGAGAGAYPIDWFRTRRAHDSVENAHSLYIETLGELGIVGAAALLLFVAAFVRGAIRARRNPTALSRGQASAVLAAAVVWLVAAGLDWDWQMPGVTGIALLLMGSVLPIARPRGTARAGRVRVAAVWGVAGLCAVSAAYLWESSVQAQRLTDANQLGSQGHYAAALATAERVSLAPASDGAQLTEAYALEDLGRLAASDRAFARAAAASPNDWVIRRDWAIELARDGQAAAARRQLRRSYLLDPKELYVALPPPARP